MVTTSNIRAIVGLLVVVAVVTVVITPAPSDDIQGILHKHKVIQMHRLPTMVRNAIGLPGAERLYAYSSQDQTLRNLIQHICTYRC